MEMLFDHDRLEVYQMARELNREVAKILGELPRGCAEPAENLGRASRSISRNIAEGGGRWTSADKANYYHIARGSATECAASLDELVDFGFVSAERVAHAKVLAWRIVAMLVGLIRSLQLPEDRRSQAKARRRFRSGAQPGREATNLSATLHPDRHVTNSDDTANPAEDSRT